MEQMNATSKAYESMIGHLAKHMQNINQMKQKHITNQPKTDISQ